MSSSDNFTVGGEVNPFVKTNCSHIYYLDLVQLGLGNTLKDIDTDQVEKITSKFFEQSYTYFNIVSKILRDNIWTVKVAVNSFGKQSSRVLSIDCETGRIISCE